MKKIILLGISLAITSFAFAQDLPPNPEPGKCYVRCTTPDVFVNETVEVMTMPAYKKLTVVPATFETVTDKVLVKVAGTKLTIVKDKWGTETIPFIKKEKYSTLSINKATFTDDSDTVEIKPKYALWELGAPAPDCASSNPDDCRYWCYKGYPAEYVTIPVKRLGVDANADRTPVSEVPSDYTKKIVVEKAHVVEEVIPEVWSTIKRTVMVKDAFTTEVVVPAVYKTVTKEVLKTKGGLTTWKEVECALVEYQALPINWNLNSATLTAQAKRIIDEHLLPVLGQNPGVKVELASHTDARGSNSFNMDLSQRRAQSVANYLVTKGINSSLLVANGYGETRLKNRCSDGVSCTEREHAINRRTEFRLIN